MAEVLDDVSPFLGFHLESYKTALRAAINAYSEALDASLVGVRSALSVVYPKVSEYIITHPLDSYVDNTAFRKAMSSYSSDIRSIIQNYITRAQTGDSTRTTNAGNDFNDVINDSNLSFYDAINSVVITDEAYQTKYDAVKTEMDAFTQSIIDQASPLSSRHQSNVLDIINDVRNKTGVSFTSFVKDRTLLRITDFRYPIEVEYDTPVDVEVDVKNIGGKPWAGWIGVTVTDEYYKKVEFNSQDGPTYTILPNISTTIKRAIILPKTVLNPKSNKHLNLGKKLTYKVSVNTVIL